MQDIQKKPVMEGLFTLDLEKPRLIGSKCKSCGTYYFPQTISCSNPDCRDKEVEQALLSRRGKLWSFTVQYYPPPPPFKMDEPFTSYGIGVVEFPEDIRVAGIMTEADPTKLKIGMEMEVILGRMYEENGQEVLTWKFRPI